MARQAEGHLVITAVLDVDRLVKLLGMLRGHHVGERANAALMADRLVRKRGLTWHDVIVMPHQEKPRHLDDAQKMAAFCRAHYQKLNAKEMGFIRSMLSWRGEPSEKQMRWLIDLYLRCGGAS
jgi:hypothetical protein